MTCMCGDSECPSCGPAQDTRAYPIELSEEERAVAKTSTVRAVKMVKDRTGAPLRECLRAVDPERAKEMDEREEMIHDYPRLLIALQQTREALKELLPSSENWACHQEVYGQGVKNPAAVAVGHARAVLDATKGLVK